MNSLLFEKILTYKSKSEEDDEITSAIEFISLIRDHYYQWLLVHYELKIEDKLNIGPEKFLNLRKFILDVLLDFLIDRIICDVNADCVYIFPDKHNIKFSRFDPPEHRDIENIIETFTCDRCKCDLNTDLYYSYDCHLDIEIYICFNCKSRINFNLLDDYITPDNTIQKSNFMYKSFEDYKNENSPLEKDQILIYDIEDESYYYTDEESDYEDTVSAYSLYIKIKEDYDISELEYQCVIDCYNIFNEDSNLELLANYNEVLEHKLRVHSYYKIIIKFGINEEHDIQGEGCETFEFIVDNSTGSKKIKNVSLSNYEDLDIWAFEYIQNRLNEEYTKNNRELYETYWQGPYKLIQW